MPVNLKGRSFLTLKDFTPDEIRYMLNLAADLKAKKRAGIRGNLLAGKNIVLLFEKTSTRTRCAFEVAAYDEGAHVTFLDSKSSQMGKKETMVDTAKVLGRFFDGIEYRGYDQKVVEGLAANAGVPVWNGLTDVDHPTQALADILTLMENTKKPLNKCKLVFCGDTRNNVAYCLMYICAKLGMHYVGWGPKELAPAADVVEYCREVAKETGAVVEYGEDKALLKGADALYTDIWASMGEEDKIPERVKQLTPYKVTGDVMKATENSDCIFLHCLPAFHDTNTTTGAQYGILPFILTSVYGTAGAIVIGVPVGLLTAVFLAKVAPPKLAAVIRTAVQLLAGIPSVVYGLVGMLVLVPGIRKVFHVPDGASLLAAIIVLAIMILPSIIKVTVTALEAVPAEYEDASLALGATPIETYFRVSVPAAKSGIAAAVVLGVGRAIGEAMAVMMVSGNATSRTPSLFESVRFLTTAVASEMSYSSGLQQQALFSIALVLFLFIMLINAGLNLLLKRNKEG